MQLEFEPIRRKSISERPKKNLVSVILTLAVVGLLILSGPISAVIVNIGVDESDSTYNAADESVVFTVDVDIEVDERVPVQNLTLVISGAASKTCVFDTAGNNLTACENLDITAINVQGYDNTTLFGYGYGYGHETTYNTSNQTFGYDYGYGYTAGYEASGTYGGELKYNVTWNLTAESPTDGSYTADLQAFAQSTASSNWRVYTDQSPTTFTIDRTAPTVLLYDYTNSTSVKNGNSLTLNISVSDAIGAAVNNCSVTFGNSSSSSTITNSSGWCNGTATIPTDMGADGVKLINITFNDTAGNTGSNATYYITLDNTAPTITIASIGGDSTSPYATTDSTPTISLTTNEVATCRYASSNVVWGSMTAFTTTAGASHSVTLGEQLSGTYTYYVICRDSLNTEGSTSFSFTLTVSSTGSGGSTGDGAGSSYTTGEVDIGAGESATITIAQADEYGVTEVLIEVVDEANDVKVVIQKFTEKPEDIIENLLDAVYNYLKITLQNLDNSNIASAKVSFKIEKSWLQENGLDPDTVLLNRYADDKWEGLETAMTGEDDTYYYYQATTPGFSYFAITAKKLGAPVCGNGVCEAGETYETCSSDCHKPSEAPVCGNNVCETGENCGNCLGDCPCASGYVCHQNVCKLESEVKKKFPLKVITIVVLMFVTIAVIVWLVQSLKEPGKPMPV